MISNRVQLCDDGAKVQLCDGGAKVQLACVCPCSPWPPVSWPCGGLTEVYHVEWEAEYRTAGGVIRERQTWAGDITADSSNPCTWRGSAARTFYDHRRDGTLCDDTRTAADFETVVYLEPCPCRWRFDFGPAFTTLTGADPAGTYTPTDSTGNDDVGFTFGDTCDDIGPVYDDDITVKITSFVVT